MKKSGWKLWSALLAPWALAALGAAYIFEDTRLPGWLPLILIMGPPLILIAAFFVAIWLMISVRN